MSNRFIKNVFFGWLFLIVLSLAINFKNGFAPIEGLVLILYIILVFCITVWITSKVIRWILLKNKPIIYNPDLIFFWNYFKEWYCYFINFFKQKKLEDTTNNSSLDKGKSIDERIDDFTKDVEGFVRKWFSLISQDDLFLKETRNLVDDIIRRFLQVIIEIDNKKLLHGILIIFLNHVTEFQKTVRRQKKKSGSIEELYRYSHIASNNSKTFEHIISQLTSKLFRQFISWEVYSSVPCKAVTSILARKLTTHLLIYISSPAFINYKLVNFCCTKEQKDALNLELYDAISLIDVDLSERSQSISQKNPNLLQEPLMENESNTPKMSPKKLCDDLEIVEKEIDENKKIDDKKMIEVSAKVEKSTPVKIYESKSTNQTWRNSSDLECISLGEDLLVLQDINDPDSEIQNLMGKKLWKDNTTFLDFLESDEKQIVSSSTQPSLEEDLFVNIPTSNIPSFISNTIKPIGTATATTLQELQQTTVNNVVKPMSQATSSAMHKIGDLQDEAAGVMEGIFDFGMAGLRKGLRLTGLQDGNEKLKMDFGKSKSISGDPSPNEVKLQDNKVKKLIKVPPVNSEDSTKSDKSEENVWVNPLVKDSPNFDGQILLEKSIPSISMEETTGSPDIEYEDTTDLATTTAKLRSLLQQKTSESTLTTPAISPMPIDETGRSLSTMSTSKEYAGSSVEDLTAVDGALPSLYKFCARTATGVFQNTLNTLKTALPGNTGDQESNRQDLLHLDHVDNWTYVASDVTQDDLSARIERLLNERRAFCIVDNAYEAIESLDILDHSESGWTTPTRKYDDDLDDLEIYIPLTKTLADIFCELVADSSNGFLVSETVVKSLLILFGNFSEEYMTSFSKKTIRNVNRFVGRLPRGSQGNPLALSIDDFTEIFLDLVPEYLQYVIGDEVFYSAIKTFLISLQCQKINEDITLQIFELFTSSLIDANSKLSPTYSA